MFKTRVMKQRILALFTFNQNLFFKVEKQYSTSELAMLITVDIQNIVIVVTVTRLKQYNHNLKKEIMESDFEEQTKIVE